MAELLQKENFMAKRTGEKLCRFVMINGKWAVAHINTVKVPRYTRFETLIEQLQEDIKTTEVEELI